MKRVIVIVYLLLGSGFLSCAQADLEAAFSAYERGDYQTAITEWRSLAVQGDAMAQFNLGQMHRLGKGIKQSDSEAVKWYLMAAKQGHKPAQQNITVMYKEGRASLDDYQQIVAADQAAAPVAEPTADGGLKAYKQGDYQTAIDVWSALAEQGDANAQFNIGQMHRFGKGIPQSDVEAAKWYGKAAAQGHSQAQHNLQLMQRDGRVTPSRPQQTALADTRADQKPLPFQSTATAAKPDPAKAALAPGASKIGAPDNTPSSSPGQFDTGGFPPAAKPASKPIAPAAPAIPSKAIKLAKEESPAPASVTNARQQPTVPTPVKPKQDVQPSEKTAVSTQSVSATAEKPKTAKRSAVQATSNQPTTASVPVKPAQAKKTATAQPSQNKVVALMQPSRQQAPSPGVKQIIHEDEWFRRQDPDGYVAQILASTSKPGIDAMLAGQNINQPASVVRVGDANRTWYVLLLGPYSSKTEAKQAPKRLPRKLRPAKTWLQRVGEVQKKMR